MNIPITWLALIGLSGALRLDLTMDLLSCKNTRDDVEH